MKISVRTLSLVISGTGLVLLGILVSLTIYWKQAEDATQQPTDFSAVPAREEQLQHLYRFPVLKVYLRYYHNHDSQK